jgi:hypothetical protein
MLEDPNQQPQQAWCHTGVGTHHHIKVADTCAAAGAAHTEGARDSPVIGLQAAGSHTSNAVLVCRPLAASYEQWA